MAMTFAAARTSRVLGAGLRASVQRLVPTTVVPATVVPASTRFSSYTPMTAPATPAATAVKPRKKVTIATLRNMYAKKDPMTMITAHDFASAHVADAAGVDMILVGDSLAMVALGMDDTSEVLVEEMLLHCRSVTRASKTCFVVGDLPMGSYEISPEQALETAIRLIKDGRAHAVKLEGGRAMAPAVHKIVHCGGIPVLGHIGLTPQRANSLGGFRVQGKTARSAMAVLDDALAIQEAGAFAVVLEAVPADVARIITDTLDIPTIGVGAGSGCSGQALVQVDLIGNFPPGRPVAKFVQQYGNVYAEARRAIEAFRTDVKGGAFPGPQHSYPMPQEELDVFVQAAAGLKKESA